MVSEDSFILTTKAEAPAEIAAGPVQNILREVYWKLALPAVGGAAVTMALRPPRSPDKLGQAATIPEKAGA